MPTTRIAVLSLAFASAALAAAACDETLPGPPPTRARCLYDRGLARQNAGQTKAAVSDYLAAAELWNQAGQSFNPHRATALLQLSGLYTTEGRWGDAAKLASQSLDLFRSSLGEHHERTEAARVRLASDYSILGEQEKAEALFQSALAPDSGLSDSDRALALNTRGLETTQRGDYESGIDLLRKAERLMAAGGNSDPAYAALTCNLAAAYILGGDTARAAPLLKKVRTIYTATLGPRHPRMANLLLQEGLLALRERKNAEAERILREGDAIAEAVFPPDSNELASHHAGLGLAYMRNGKLGEAEPLLASALQTRRINYTEPHRELAVAISQLAALRAAQHRNTEAAGLYEEAVSAYERALGPNNPELRSVLDEYARFAKAARNDGLAKSLERRAKAIHSFR